MNTFYDKPREPVWTHQGSNSERLRQIDHICFDLRLLKWTTDAEANDLIGVGSGHKCVTVKLRFPQLVKQMCGIIARKERQKTTGWQPSCLNTFWHQFSSQLQESSCFATRIMRNACFCFSGPPISTSNIYPPNDKRLPGHLFF